uniref:Uncharacterized protein n=1 Tax=Anopheles maculatus TaxID=74869 RepID=A0A182TA07_9DIPT
MLELLDPDIVGEVHFTRPATAATTRSALEAIKKKFELAAATASAAANEKLLLEKAKETKTKVVGSAGVPSTPDGAEPSPAKPPPASGLIDSRECAKPAKKVSSAFRPLIPQLYHTPIAVSLARAIWLIASYRLARWFLKNGGKHKPRFLVF